jgi:hypothetical protein
LRDGGRGGVSVLGAHDKEISLEILEGLIGSALSLLPSEERGAELLGGEGGVVRRDAVLFVPAVSILAEMGSWEAYFSKKEGRNSVVSHCWNN